MLVAQRLAREEVETLHEHFSDIAEKVSRQFSERLQTYEYGLIAARSAVVVLGSRGITRQKFIDYSDSLNLDKNFPGSRGFGFIRRVPKNQEVTFLKEARQDGKPDFQIKQLAPQDGERFVIQYIEPEDNNKAAVGLDVASETNRREAALKSIEENTPVFTQPITLVQATEKSRYGLLFFLPVFEAGAPVETAQQRMQSTYGWVYTPLNIDEVFRDLDLNNGELSLIIYNADKGVENDRFFASNRSEEPVIDDLIRQIPVSIYGRKWSLEIKATSDFVKNMHPVDSRLVALGLMLLSALSTVLFYHWMVSAQRRRESQLDKAKLAAIVESASDAIISENLNGVVTSWNRSAERIFGYAANEAIGKALIDLIVPRKLKAEEAERDQEIWNGHHEFHRYTALRQRKSGDLVDVTVNASMIFEPDGKVVGAAKTFSDVTEERRAAARFRMALDAAGLAIWVWNPESNQLIWDDRMLELYGAPQSLRESGLYYDFWASHVHPDDRARVEDKLQQLLNGTGLYDPTFRIIRDDGEIRHVRASAILESDFDGRPIQIVGTNLDITAEQNAISAADRANQAKSDFLSNMSHEIRTPMNGVLGMAQLLVREPLTADQREMVSSILAAGDSLLRIINDILDFSKIEAGQIRIDRNPFTLTTLLSHLDHLLRPSAENKGLQLTITPTHTHLGVLLGDQLRLEQILINLIGNAIKFTERGQVTLNMVLVEEKERSLRLRFELRDTGIGMSPDTQARLFRAFSQGDSSITRKFGGTGLGLSISKRLVELMGGELGVISAEGQGSTFWFEVPFDRESDHDQLAPPPEPVPQSHDATGPRLVGLRVLAVDDSRINLMLLERVLKNEGAGVSLAADGQQALQILKAMPSGFDVVLMDIQMPVMDGLTATREIRDDPMTSHLPVIALTAGVLPEERQAAINAGVNDFLAKPMDLDLMVDMICRHSSGGSSATPS